MPITLSYSGLSTYDQCPSKFERRYITKEKVEKDMGTEASNRGSRLHKCVEDLINGEIEDLPKEIDFYTDFFTEIKKRGGKAETEFAFNNRWESVDFKDPDAMIRGFIDAEVDNEATFYVYELKTGKMYDEHAMQRSLYGLAALLLHPLCQSVIVVTTYLDLQTNVSSTYKRSMLMTYKWVWEEKVRRATTAKAYPMRPSWKCRFCVYSTSKGGTCPNE